MDVAALLLPVVLVAVLAYALYWVVRKGVAAGIRDAERERLARRDRVG